MMEFEYVSMPKLKNIICLFENKSSTGGINS